MLPRKFTWILCMFLLSNKCHTGVVITTGGHDELSVLWDCPASSYTAQRTGSEAGPLPRTSVIAPNFGGAFFMIFLCTRSPFHWPVIAVRRSGDLCCVACGRNYCATECTRSCLSFLLCCKLERTQYHAAVAYKTSRIAGECEMTVQGSSGTRHAEAYTIKCYGTKLNRLSTRNRYVGISWSILSTINLTPGTTNVTMKIHIIQTNYIVRIVVSTDCSANKLLLL